MADGTLTVPVAIVVGASSGIGEAVARDLARRGWRVGLAARRAEKLAALAAEIGGGAAVAVVDLDAPEAARVALAGLADTLGTVDLWVLNAGTGDNNP